MNPAAARYRLCCESCGREAPPARSRPYCPDCGGLLRGRYSSAGFDYRSRPRGLWDYAPLLPIQDLRHVVSLGEGATPLLRARSFASCVWIKNEAANPTGSQKDRAMSVAISKACELGVRRTIVASTGSSGLACAAYSARAGLPCIVLVPGGTPPDRIGPMAAHGAAVAEVQGDFQATARLLDGLDADSSFYMASTNRRTNPFQADGTRTIAFEIVASLGKAPDWLVAPVGGGGTLAGVWRGFLDMQADGAIGRLPRLVSVQPQGLDSLVVALAQGLKSDADFAEIPIDHAGSTVMLNLRSGRRSDLADAAAALRHSDGIALAVSDAEALEWQGRLATVEGILAEPSGSAAMAGFAKLAQTGAIAASASVVVLVTGSALRQPSSLPLPRILRLPPDATPGTLDAIAGGNAVSLPVSD